MAIEPLNSAMTYQAQTVARPQTATPVNTEVPEDGQTVNVDATTASVTKTQAEEEKGSSEGNGSQQQQQSMEHTSDSRSVKEDDRRDEQED